MDRPQQTSALEGLERLLAAGKDSALLRFGLGNEHLKRGDALSAAAQFKRAVELDPAYSAAWKMLGKALAGAQRPDEALAAWNEGIAAAQRKGDKQAMREMEVFARRLAKPAERK
jgi:tetratricopeptide (TPR) repeat protein